MCARCLRAGLCSRGWEAAGGRHAATRRSCLPPSHPFRIENDLLTPSMKLKRPQLAKHFQPQIDAMYREIKAAAAAK